MRSAGSGCQARSPTEREPPHVGLHRGVGADEPRRQHPVGSAASAGESSSSAAGQQLRGHQVARGGGERVARPAGEQGDVGAGQGAEPQVHLGDDPEPAEAADLELGEIVARDVLHHPPAGASPGARRRWRRCSRGRDRAPGRSRGAAGPRWRSRRPSRGSAPAGPADRARATCPRRRAAGGAPRAACPPAPWRPGRRGSPTAPGRAPRVLTARSAGASAASQVPWPSTRIFQPSSCASRQTSESASAESGVARGQPVRRRARRRRCRAARAGGRRRRRSSRAAGVARHSRQAWSGTTLPGLARSAGIEGAAHRAHGAERLGVEDQRHVVDLVRAHAVLAGDAAAGSDAGRHDLPAGQRAPGRARSGSRRSKLMLGCRLPSPAWKTLLIVSP